MPDRPSSVDRVYDTLRAMAVQFDFKPGERINETTWTKALNVSRTPLREALNRLVAEGFLTFASGQGFFCRLLSPEKVLELYHLRCAVECEALRRGVATASASEIAALCAYLDQTEPAYGAESDLSTLLEMDERFHMGLVGLSGNDEFLRLARNVNDRIRYVRLINLRQLQEAGQLGQGGDGLSAHRVIAEAVRQRQADRAVAALRAHVADDDPVLSRQPIGGSS